MRSWRWVAAALTAAGLACGGPLFAATDAPTGPAPRPAVVKIKSLESTEEDQGLPANVGLIDVPTAGALDYGGYLSQSRFYSGGGALEYLSFGVYSGLDIGASLSIDGVVGAGKSVHVQDPEPQIKYRFYDGTTTLPALALGYDGQGYNYNQPAKAYNEHRRGLYLVGSERLFLPGLEIHPSVNLSDFNSRSWFGAAGLSYNIKDKVLVMAEWDNINTIAESRFNSGLRLYLTQHFYMDLAVRAIGQGGIFSDGQPRGPERVVQLWYSSSF